MGPLLGFVLVPLAAIALEALGSAWLERAERGRAGTASPSRVFTCPAWLGTGTLRATPGRLTRFPSGACTWTRRGPFGRTEELGVVDPARTRREAAPPVRARDRGLAVPTSRGPATLWLSGGDAATLRRLGRAITHPGSAPGGRVPAAAPRQRRRVAWAVLVVGVLWLAFWVLVTVVNGDRVTGTVRTNDGEDYCSVSYVQDGRPHNAGVDCTDERPGDPLEVLAVGWPFTGNAVDTSFAPWFLAGVGWVLTAAGALLVLRPHPRATGAGGWSAVAPASTRDLPELPDTALTPAHADSAKALLTTWHPYAAAQLPAPDEWEDADRPEGSPAPELLPRLVGAFAGPALAVAVVVLVGEDVPVLRRRWVLSGLLLAALVWLVLRLGNVRAERVAFRATAARGSRQLTGLLAAGPFGDPALLLVDPLVHPVRAWLVPVRLPLPTGTVGLAHRGPLQLSVRGELRDDAYVLAEAAGGVLAPAASAWEPGVEDLRDVLDPLGG